MELIRGLHNLRPKHRGCAVTVGAFDGVHRGHQAVLGHLQAEARARGLATTVVTFEPLPREYFMPLEAPPRITNFRERALALSVLGIDRLMCISFDEILRSMSAQEFLEQVFVEGLGAEYILLGDDFRFGHSREGDLQYVLDQRDRWAYEAQSIPTFEFDGVRISSTRLREALAEGDFLLAAHLLGRPFTMQGRVEYGKQLGRQLGAPTANVKLHRLRSPLSGVFAVRVTGPGLDAAHAVANVGVRPTVDDGIVANLEVHVLDRTIDLYGKRISVEFFHKLRDEKKYDSLDALRAGIAQDMNNARQWLAGNPVN